MKMREFMRLVETAFMDNPRFRAWFSGSKALDDDGSPAVFYHFTHNDIEVFDRMWAANTFKRDPEGIDTVGLWFTNNPDITYGPKRMDCYLQVRKPLYLDDTSDEHGEAPYHDMSWMQLFRMCKEAGGANALRDRLKAQGYDSIVFPGTHLDGKYQVVIIVFEPNQIKSVKNNGAFDPDNHSVLAEDEDDDWEETDYRAVSRKAMADIIRFARSNGVDIRLRWNSYGRPNEVEITDLNARVTGTGAGTRVMEFITKRADTDGLTILVKPGTPRNKEFYQRFGFESSNQYFGSMVRFAPLPFDYLDEGLDYRTVTSPDQLDGYELIDMPVLYRGVEGGTDGKGAIRMFRGGDMGDGVYLTPWYGLATSYGGTPKSRVSDGSRVVHRYRFSRSLYPEEVVFMFGGSREGQDVTLVTGGGVEIWRGPWRVDQIEAALSGEDVKVVVGTRHSVGLNQVCVRDFSLLVHDDAPIGDEDKATSCLTKAVDLVEFSLDAKYRQYMLESMENGKTHGWPVGTELFIVPIRFWEETEPYTGRVGECNYGDKVVSDREAAAYDPPQCYVTDTDYGHPVWIARHKVFDNRADALAEIERLNAEKKAKDDAEVDALMAKIFGDKGK